MEEAESEAKKWRIRKSATRFQCHPCGALPNHIERMLTFVGFGPGRRHPAANPGLRPPISKDYALLKSNRIREWTRLTRFLPCISSSLS